MLSHYLPLVLVLLTVALNTAAQVLLKVGSGGGILNFSLFGGLGLYGLSTLFYISVLGKFNLSFAYPVIIGLTVISTTLCGKFLFNESIDHVSYAGIGLMLVSIFAISFGRLLPV
jgi:multidrug transporter EmrE-like cation transporter